MLLQDILYYQFLINNFMLLLLDKQMQPLLLVKKEVFGSPLINLLLNLNFPHVVLLHTLPLDINKSIILQWGYVNMNWQDASVTITYPISYSHNPYVVTGKIYWNAHANVSVYITARSNTTVTLHQYGYGSAAYWISIGQ